MQHYYYLLIDLACISVPFIASFYPKHPFHKEWKYFFPANVIVAVFFLVWDEIFTEKGVWGFNPDYLTGVYVGSLPIEEVLFFICIPYACVFTFFALEFLMKKNISQVWDIIPRSIITLICIWFIVQGFDLLYTFWTGVFCYVFLLICRLSGYKSPLSYLSYLLIYPFFLISNGILTGTGLASPIVWYNDAENLGIRMGTIPVEDSVYGFLLIFMNIYFYALLRKRKATRNTDRLS